MSGAPKAKVVSKTPVKTPTKSAGKEKEEHSWEAGPDPATFSMPENSPFRDDVDLKMHGQEVKMAPSDKKK
uniref:RPN2_C domain-containing protein n=1 Tax=Panagrellus redivivus TaxID=6233 RepID=A0A7E4V6A0_PANRE